MSDIEEIPAAGFWRRFASVFIDGLAFIPLSMAGMYVMFVYPEQYILYTVFLYVVLAAYYTLMIASRWQATLGMRLMKVYGVDLNGEKLSRLHVFKWIVISALFFLLAFLPLYFIVPPGASLEEQLEAMRHPYYWYANIYAYIFLIIWAFTIGLSKRKVGLHNKVAKTRFLKGRI